MKIRLLLTFLCLICFGNAHGQVTSSNLLTYTSINATSNSGTSAIIGTARIPMPVYALQHGALTATNNVTYYSQISFDGVNFLTFATNNPTRTNDGAIDTFQPSAQRMVVYTRVIFATTNNVSAGGSVTLGSGL